MEGTKTKNKMIQLELCPKTITQTLHGDTRTYRVKSDYIYNSIQESTQVDII